MKPVTKNELIQKLTQENSMLKASAMQNASNIDYIAMIAGAELETEEKEETGDEQQI